jgi:hypothetical protein
MNGYSYLLYCQLLAKFQLNTGPQCVQCSTSKLDCHDSVPNSTPLAVDQLSSSELVIVALMFWSDVTHLTSFGDAKIWPFYMFFGNESLEVSPSRRW